MRVVRRVFRRERRHVAEGNHVVLHVVEPHAVDLPEEVGEHRAVHHAPGLVLLGLDAPDLLDAGLVGLGIRALEAEAVDQLLRARSAHALAEHRHAREDVHARLVVGLRLAVLVDAHVAGPDADDAVALGQDLCRSEARIDLDPDCFALRRQPLHDVRERHDVVALLLEHRGRDGGLDRALAGEEPEIVLRAGVLDREALLPVIGHELFDRPRVHHAARELVVADIGGFLDHEDRGGLDRRLAGAGAALVVGLDLLHQVIGAGESRRAGTHEQDVDLHALAFGLAHRSLSFRGARGARSSWLDWPELRRRRGREQPSIGPAIRVSYSGPPAVRDARCGPGPPSSASEPLDAPRSAH